MAKVNWHPWRPGDDNHPLFIDQVYIGPKKYFDTEDFSSYDFYHCPETWNSCTKNTWVFYSRFDWNVELIGGQVHVHTDHNHFNELMGDIQVVNDEMIIQLDPLAYCGPIIKIFGWNNYHTLVWKSFLVSLNWAIGLTLSLAFRTKHLNIKRGDPIFMVRFNGVVKIMICQKQNPQRKL